MTIANISQALQKVITAITNYEQGTNTNSQEVTSKVQEFVKGNQQAISDPQRTAINSILGRLTNLKTKTSTCQELTTLIKAIANTIQPKEDGPKTAAAEKDDKGLAENVQSIVEENQRFAEANLIIQKSVSAGFFFDMGQSLKKLAEEIQTYQLSEPHRIEIAEILAEKSPHFAAHMQQFTISDEATRFRIAKIIAKKQNPRHLCEHIDQFKLSEDNRISIAKIIAVNEQTYASLPENIQKFTTKKGLVDILKLLANNYYSKAHTHERMSKFDLTEDERFDLASVAAGSDTFFYNIQHYKLSYAHRLAIAKTGAITNIDDLTKNIKSFELCELDRLELAKVIALQSLSKISSYIGDFELTDENNRIAIAKIATAGVHGSIQFHDIKKYQLTKPAHILFTALRFCHPDEVLNCIEMYKKACPTQKDCPPVFAEVQKSVDASQDEKKALWFKAFNIVINSLNEKDHKECASLAALMMNFDPEIRYRLTDAIYVYGIPATIPSKEPHLKIFNLLLAPLIINSQLQDSSIKALWESLGSPEYKDSPVKQEKVVKGLYSLLICTAFSAKEKGTLLKHIIENKQAPLWKSLQMLEVIISSDNATLLKTSNESASKEADIKSLASSDVSGSLKQPIDLASIISLISNPFKNTENTVRAIASNFDLFAIEEESDRLRIANSIAALFPRFICENIDKFNLSEDNRIALAKSLAVRDEISTHLFENFQRFHLKKGYLVEIVNLLAANSECFGVLSKYIKKFGLTEQERFVAAKIFCATSQATQLGYKFEGTIENIHEFELRYEFRLFIARMIPASVAKHIQRFNLNEQDRFEIAKLIARQTPSEITQNISEFELKDESQRLAIAKLAASKDGLDTLAQIRKYQISNPETILFVVLRFSQPEEAQNIIQTYRPELVEATPYPKAFDQLAKSIGESQNESAKTWFNVFDVTFPRLNCKDWTECASLAEVIVDLNPELRYMLTAAISQYGIPATVVNGGHAKLINLLISPWIKDSQLTNDDIQTIYNTLASQPYRESPSKKEKVFKGLYSLLECTDLTAKEKGELLKHIIENDKKIPAHSSLQMLDAIIFSDNTTMLRTAQAQLKEADEKGAKDSGHRVPLKHPIDIESSLREIFKISIGMAEESVKDFGNKFNAIIANARNPMALLIYAANLGALPKSEREETLKSLKVFTESVLNGTYKAIRYQTSTNPHLATVFENRPQLQKEWQQSSSFKISELFKKLNREMDTKEKAEEVNVVEYLQQRVCNFKHLDPEKFKFFAASLKEPKNCRAQLQACQKSLGEALLKSGLTIKEIKEKPIDEKTLPVFLLHLETNLISFVVTPEIKKIKHLLTDVKKLRELAQFAQDLEDLKKKMEDQQLRNQQLAKQQPSALKAGSNYDDYIVADTDEWEDMELCGTEITGSCQRIGGSLQHNKCLLAYMLDGKNRAIVIKDPKTGKIDPKTGKIDPATCRIVARRIMRLMWDETNKRPVIFKEHLYDNNVPQRAKQAIDLMFEMRARQLNLPLVQCTTTETTAKPYESDLQSLFSPAPYEYVDAAGVGIANDGIFTIPSDHTEVVNT